jgi:hypothetical protein
MCQCFDEVLVSGEILCRELQFELVPVINASASLTLIIICMLEGNQWVIVTWGMFRKTLWNERHG